MERDDNRNSKIEAEETEALGSRVSDFSLREEIPKQNLDSRLVRFRFSPFGEFGFVSFCLIFLFLFVKKENLIWVLENLIKFELGFP